MLRRKKKSQRPPREAQHAAPAPRSRRRARPDAEVPAELILSPEAERAARESAQGVRRPRNGAAATRSVAPAPSVVAPAQPAVAPARSAVAPAQPAVAPAHSAVAPAQAAVAPAHPAVAPAKAGDQSPNPDARRRGHERRNPRVILVTGFEPFGGEASNPSWEVCKRLPREIAGRRVETCRIPCEFRTAIEVVAEAIERHQPEIVLSLGQAGGRSQVGMERVAINVDDARGPDNAGYQPVDEPVAENGPPAYFSTLPVKAMVAAMRAAQVPAELSNSAGTYVCNHLMYGVLHFLAASGKPGRAGFAHVPYSEEQVLDRAGVPGMSIATMARGIEAALVAACENQRDIATAEGTLD